MAVVDRTDTGRIILVLEHEEKQVLRSLADQLIAFVAPVQRPDADPLYAIVGIEPEAHRPDDPALARLLPDAYRDDAEAADDFRRFTERALRETKLAHARTVLQSLERSGEKVTLAAAEIDSWLGFLNDARLTLGTRLEITEDNHDELEDLGPDDPRFGWMQVYGWLTSLQDALLHLLLP